MRNSSMRVLAALAAGAALGALGLAGGGAPGAAAGAVQAARASAGGSAAAAGPGTELWVRRYNSSTNDEDVASSVAVSPRGGRVFVTGHSDGGPSRADYATVAYSAATGARLWVSRYNSPGNGNDSAAAVAVSPAGQTVFVTGDSDGASATVAYSAATGAQLWAQRYDGPGHNGGSAVAVAVSPAGQTVFVTGASIGAGSGWDYATVAYDAVTGARLWASRYNGPRNGYDSAAAIAVSPSGQTVLVTGMSAGAGTGYDYATVAYDAATGARRWVSRYNGGAKGRDGAAAVAVGPGGKTVFVTGSSARSVSRDDYATVAYSVATGTRRWVSRYNGPGNSDDSATAVAAGPGARTVYVTGSSVGTTSGLDAATIAYSAATGARRWVSRYNGPRNSADSAAAVAVGSGGGKVFVTGRRGDTDNRISDCFTVAYSAGTGARLWARRYHGPVSYYGNDGAVAVAAGPGGGRVFIAGYTLLSTTGDDYLTIGYSS